MSDPTFAAPTPEAILGMDRPKVRALFAELEARVPTHPKFLAIPGPFREAIVIGDSHGDWRSTREAVGRFEAGGIRRCFVGLGDYIDRAPKDCGAGSVANALYLLGLVARYPDRVFLLQGNHEATRSIPASPHDLPAEVERLWGPGGDEYARLMGLLERGPYAAALPNAIYCAHAGFPLIGNRSEWAGAFDHLDDDRAMQILWAECDESKNRRGAGIPWGGRDLERFFRATAFRLFLRGHDPDLTGQPLYDGRCLTLQTTRLYERFGGVLTARVPTEHPVLSLRDVGIEHLPTEGRRFPAAP